MKAKQTSKTKLVSRLLALFMVLAVSIALLPTFTLAEERAELFGYESELDASLAYLVTSVPAPDFGTSGGEWTIFALARAGYNVPAGYYDGYTTRIETMLTAGGNAKLDNDIATENQRLILAYTAMGIDATNINGSDIVAPLGDFDWVTRNGVNGAAYALIALNSMPYGFDALGSYTNQTTEQALIDFILDKELSTGGFSGTGVAIDPDMTCIAIQALAPYYRETGREDVTNAVVSAIVALSGIQFEDGGFGVQGVSNAESCAQAIVALATIGIDPQTDERFVKAGGDAVSALLGFYVPGGGFKHIATQNVPNGIATDQSVYALVAYDRFLAGENTLYDISDAFGGSTDVVTANVTFSYQENKDGFKVPRKTAVIASDLSEQYGYSDDFNGETVSALDVMVAAHIAVFGDDKAVINSKMALDNGAYGDFVSNFMGDGRGDVMFYVNSASPWVGAPSCEIQDGDIVELFAVRETVYYSDLYGEFTVGGTKTESVSVEVGEDIVLNLQGTTWEGSVPVEGATVKTVNAATGAFGDVLDVTDTDGNITLNFSTAGTYIIGAIEQSGALPLMSPWLVVTVTADVVTTTANVTFSYQENTDGFKVQRKTAIIASDLSEQYGYNDALGGETVSALDVMVAAHIAVFGDDKAVINSKMELSSGDYGDFVSNFMGDGRGDVMFYVNSASPWVGAPSCEIQDGDIVELFAVRETVYYSDLYGEFTVDGAKTESVSAKAGANIALNLQGTTWEGSVPVKGAVVMAVNATTGAFGNLLGVTDDNGNVTIKFNTAGTYIIGAAEENGALPLMSPWLVVTVTGTTTTPTTPKITVSFRLVGATLSDGDVNLPNGDYKGSEYVTWIATKSFTMDQGDTMYELFTKAVSGSGLTAVGADRNYIRSITAPKAAGGYALGEFANGPYSGWMYTVNGVHVGSGLKDQVLKDGDKIVWHYVNDHRYEVKDAVGGSLGSSTYWDGWTKVADKNPTSTTTTTPGGGGNPAVITTPNPSATPIPTAIPPVVPTPSGSGQNTYTDVQTGDWFVAAVKYVSDNGIMTGTGDGAFSPNADVTRAMLAVILYRQSGVGAPSIQNPFTDVADGTWYTQAILWGVENGVITGYGDGTFGPDNALTREQIAAILYRYAISAGKDVSQRADIFGYADASAVSEWALDAMQWANAAGIINGRSDTELAPLGNATRAEMAAMIQRFIEQILV